MARRRSEPNVSLSSYTIRVRDTADPNEAVRIDRYGKGDDLLDVLHNYLKDLKVVLSGQLKLKLSPDPVEANLMVVTELYSNGRYLYGILQTGDYGYESTLIDLDTQKVAHRRKSREAEVMPFYFLVFLPQNANEGVVVVQRFKSAGIREVLLSAFEKYFKERYDIEADSFRIEINPLVESELINFYMKNSSIKKIRMVQFKMPSNIVKAMDLEDHLEELGTIEISISARPNGTLNGLKHAALKALGRKDKLKGLTEFQFPKMNFDTVKCEVDIGGARRTIDLVSPFEAASSYDISKRVEMDNGHPVFDSINKIAFEYCDRVYASLRKGLRTRAQAPPKKGVPSYAEQD